MIKPNQFDPKNLYARMLGFIELQQHQVTDERPVEIHLAFQLAEEIVSSIEMSDLLNAYAVNYFDMEDISISHAANVAVFSVTIARGIGYSHPELVSLCAAGLLHDIGIGKINPNIVHKNPRAMTPKEQRAIETHSQIGYHSILHTDSSHSTMAEIVLQHHERSNGSGYPNALWEADMLDDAKILSLIDAYEALLHPRERRDALVPPQGLSQILTQEGNSFPKKLVRTLVEQISIYPVGCYVLLSTGETGRVIKTNPRTPSRPTIKILYDRKGLKQAPEIMDLNTDYLMKIEKCVPIPASKPSSSTQSARF